MSQGDNRKLTTILAIDMAGYSAQSERNQQRAIEYVTALRERAAAIAFAQGGHIFNTAGDGLMLEFPIASGAVRTALTLAEEATQDPNRLPRIRSGVHLGEVVIDGNDRLGHGVNVAARLMQMAPPNGVVISETVKDQLRDETRAVFAPCGRVRLKKMRETVFAFEHIAGASVARRQWRRWRTPLLSAATALALVAATLVGAALFTAPSETPFVAVMPFDNLSGDPTLAYFSDGLSTEIQATLAQYQQGLRVAGLASSFRFRGAEKDPANVRRRMGATHIVDGSVRRAGNDVRIVAELLDARSGAVLWTQTYDRSLGNTLEVQALIARQIGHILRAAAPDVAAPPAQMDASALEHYLNAVDELDGNNSGPNVDRAVADLEETIAGAPQFARAWALLSSAYSRQARVRNEAEQAALIGRARLAAQKAFALDPHLALAEAMLGRVEPEWNWEARNQHYRRALALAPNDVRVLVYWSDFLWRTGRERDHADVTRQIFRLDPLSRTTRLLIDFHMLSDGDVAGAIQEAERLTSQHEYGMKNLWEAILYNRENADDLPGAQRALRELERMFAGQNLSDGDRHWFAGMHQDVEMLKNGPFREAYIRRVEQSEYDRVTGPGIGQECVAEQIPEMASNLRPDLAWRLIETLYIHKGYVGTTDSCPQAVYPEREANTGFLFEPAGGGGSAAMADILRNPRIWATFDAVGLTRYWRETHAWPDFCSDPRLPYDCRAIAAARR